MFCVSFVDFCVCSSCCLETVAALLFCLCACVMCSLFVCVRPLCGDVFCLFCVFLNLVSACFRFFLRFTFACFDCLFWFAVVFE